MEGLAVRLIRLFLSVEILSLSDVAYPLSGQYVFFLNHLHAADNASLSKNPALTVRPRARQDEMMPNDLGSFWPKTKDTVHKMG